MSEMAAKDAVKFDVLLNKVTSIKKVFESEDGKESEMEILHTTERSMVRAMCGVQLKDRKR